MKHMYRWDVPVVWIFFFTAPWLDLPGNDSSNSSSLFVKSCWELASILQQGKQKSVGLVGRLYRSEIALKRWITCSSILSQPLVDLFHPFDVDEWYSHVIHHRKWVIPADDALGRPLRFFRRVPRLVDVLKWEVFQDRLVLSVNKWKKKKNKNER